MGPVTEQIDIRSNSEAFEDYIERFESWSMTKKDEDGKIVTHFLTSTRKDSYSLLKNLKFLDNAISLHYGAL
ncbi:unnamed protein product [Schistosoma curassoni]|uniref:Uncharacterized protein n=1 Tax=Schistosoma curassoni TaxID=6186 RepID=A0A183JWZ9_9TREM|nr:unnamed protein product [Schistosoma curassoni]